MVNRHPGRCGEEISK